MECQRSRSLRTVVNGSGLNTPDGMPLVWLARRINSQVSRVYGPDLMLAEMARSVGLEHRHFFYGGRTGVPETLARALAKRFPGIHVVGTLAPAMGTVDELCASE